MFKHLLVPTDDTDATIEMVRRAVSFARDIGARITFLYVEHSYPALSCGETSLVDVDASESFRECEERKSRGILDIAQSIAYDSDVSCTTIAVVSESPYRAIVEAAERNVCDLIFMVAHGRNWISRLLFGSVSEEVQNHTKIPVLVNQAIE